MKAIERVQWRIIGATLVFLLTLGLAVAEAQAASAHVIDVKIRQTAAGAYNFDVTVRSDDNGWKQYADAIEVLTPDGQTLLKRRILLHPHDTEQPFTRDVYGVAVPQGMTSVLVRARMKPDGYTGDTMTVKLPGR